MDDIKHVGTLFLIFAVVLLLYGEWMRRTGNKGLIPVYAVHSIRNSQDVKRVGRAVSIVALVIGSISLAILLFAGA